MLYVKEFIEEKKNQNLREATIKEYEYYLRCFENFLLERFGKSHFTKHSFKHIKRVDIQKYIDSIRDSGKSVATAKKHLTYIREYIYFLEGMELIDSYCTSRIKIKKDSGVKKLKHHMNLEDGWKFYNAITNDKDKLMIGLAMFHGFRRQEISSVEIKNVDLENWTILFIRKGQFEELIYVVDELKEYLKKQVEFCKENNHVYLFQSPKFIKTAQPLSLVSVWKVFKYWLEKAGLGEYDYSVHDGRRFFALSLYEEGYSEDDIRIALSHASPTTTRLYINKSRESVMKDISQRKTRVK